ncbi:MAG: transglycosylase domain-containing protein, partial [Clostridia bacterium]
MESRKARHRRSSWVSRAWHGLIERVSRTGASITLPLLVVAVVAVVGPGTFLALPLPTLPIDTMVYDTQGQLLAELYNTENRIPVPSTQIPPVMKNALVAIEDDRFWIEPNIDPVGIARAAFTDLVHRQVLQGGSTLTQQLAKNLYLTQQRTLSRKVAELFLTLKLGSTYTKSQVLDEYLNDVYFGQGAYGIGAASEVYFGHGPATLTLPEAALLAGMVTAPSYYDPYANPQGAVQRRNAVLVRMASLHYISPAEAIRAEAAPLSLAGAQAPNWEDRAPYYFALVNQELAQVAPAVASHLYTGGYRITVSLKPKDQTAANTAFAADMPPATSVNGVPEPEGALVGLNPANGNITALVGGRNYSVSTFNRATAAFRQPGSVFKYFLYTTAIAEGYPTSSVKDSASVRFPNGHGGWYVPHNFGNVFNGPLTMREAIAMSDDIVALKWMNTLGPPAVIAMAHKMGMTSPLADNLTTALGSSSVSPLQVADGIATLANGGYRVTPRAVLSVQDAAGRVVYQAPTVRTRVVSPQVAYVVDQLFTAPLTNASGTANNLTSVFWRPGAAKTGTSSGQRDAWLAGFTPQLVGVVWVGNDNNTSFHMTGDVAAGPVWAAFMSA